MTANPRATFFIISKDGDYDAMIAHLQRNGVVVSRHAAIDVLPFLTPMKKSGAKKSDLETVIDRLARNKTARPKMKKSLLSLINSWFQNGLSTEALEKIIHDLTKQKLVAIDDKGHLTYTLDGIQAG